MLDFEICPECYEKHFLFCNDIKIVTSKEKYKCSGCGKIKHAVREVWANGKIVDIN